MHILGVKFAIQLAVCEIDLLSAHSTSYSSSRTMASNLLLSGTCELTMVLFVQVVLTPYHSEITLVVSAACSGSKLINVILPKLHEQHKISVGEGHADTSQTDHGLVC